MISSELHVFFRLFDCIIIALFEYYRIILIAEKETVYEKFPTPLINRLEKHFVTTKTILSELQMECFWKLKAWFDDFWKIIDTKTR